jgi:RNA polymerase sigma-70 factor (ECF subfamily)
MERMPNWRDINDVQLMALAQDGDAEAFGELYERYSPTVHRFLYAHLNDRLDAEDLTEEVFLRVWRTLPNYNEQGVPLLAYFFKIARNALIDFYRRAARSGMQMTLETSNIVDHRPDPGDAALARMEHQEIRQMLDQLSEDYRNVLVLRFLSELSAGETAHVMGRSEGAVRILQHRALAALREMIDLS